MFRPFVPANVKIHTFEYQKMEEIPLEVFDRIRAGFAAQQNDKPLISVNIIAWNEESNILRNLSSLSAIRSLYPVEFIFVDNNSKDKTSEIIRKCGITPVFESKQGYGFARQAAMENSHGKYIITGDADTIYPSAWIDAMLNPILSGKGFATYGTYSFITKKSESRLKYAFYEFFRDMVHALRTINRPELAVGGVNFCFPREEALKIGFIKSDSRMEDGKMAFAISNLGKLKRITGIKARAWTITRSVDQSGSLLVAMLSRIPKQLKWFKLYFFKKK